MFYCIFILYCIADNVIPAISGLDPMILSRLHTLELRGNKLTTTAGLNLPNLKNLFLVSIVCLNYTGWSVTNLYGT